MGTFNKKPLRGVQGAPWHGGPIRDGFVAENFFDNSTCTWNLHLSPLAENSPPGRRRQEMILLLVLLVLIFLLSGSIMKAQTRRALLVGINKYEPKVSPKANCRKEWWNLCGCINDVDAMEGMLTSSRFGFKTENIRVLKNEEATRERILAELQRYLIDNTFDGDICVFYYSGHGSRVKNSMSDEPDKMDETLVPADWYRGVKDIRDKELKKLYNRVLDKHADLTVIVDACHSGSSSRGIPVRLRYRTLPPDQCDIAEPSAGEKSPAERGALIFSAAQDFQGAVEIEDENNNYHGLFTWALIKMLRDIRGVAPARDILLKVKALMQSENPTQEPNLEGLPEKTTNSILGIKTDELFRPLRVAVLQVRRQLIELQGGLALGIREGCELKKATGKHGNEEVQIQVTAVHGLNRCTAQIIEGDVKKIKVGDLYELDKWVAAREAPMLVRVPVSDYSFKNLTSIAAKIAGLRQFQCIYWVEDPTEMNPTHIISWHQSDWRLEMFKNDRSLIVKLGRNPGIEVILKEILKNRNHKNIKPRVFLQLPLSVELARSVNAEMEGYNHSIQISSLDEGAHYILVGRLSPLLRDKSQEPGANIQYAWVLPNMTHEEKRDFSLPVRTGWISAEKGETRFQELAEKLTDKILHLVRIRAWFQLSSPLDNGHFPYRLALKNAETGEITTTGSIIEGETYGLILRADKTRLKSIERIEKRYVYVFSIDSYGNGTLLFPRQTYRNTENCFPAIRQKFFAEVSRVQGNEQSAKRGAQREYTINAVRQLPGAMHLPPGDIELGSRELFIVGEPFGIDTFILLTSTDVISHPWVLDFKGVRKGMITDGYSPLEELLYNLSSVSRRTRGRPLPINWSIQRLPILSKSK